MLGLYIGREQAEQSQYVKNVDSNHSLFQNSVIIDKDDARDFCCVFSLLYLTSENSLNFYGFIQKPKGKTGWNYVKCNDFIILRFLDFIMFHYSTNFRSNNMILE